VRVVSEPYYADATVTLWHGDMRDLIGEHIDPTDLMLADPPYGETSLAWDRWPSGWLDSARRMTSSLWCFGSMRSMGLRWTEFLEAGWTYSQDVVWEKHNGSGFHADRFRRVHEHATFWYRGSWADTFHQVPTTADAVAKQVRRKQRPTHMGDINRSTFVSEDGGPRLMRSVLPVRSMHGSAIHPTEKPVGLLDPLIRYACPPGGTVLDPFAGSGSTAVAARLSGRKAVLIEADERYCEAIARRLQETLPIEVTS
jgi:site-specific DNA-methyltransferase (adenine-specific)